MNKTLNNITDALLELCVNHKMVNDFAVGDVADIGKKKLSPDSERLEYPYVWWVMVEVLVIKYTQ